jgi:hypothetical protein
MDTPLLSWPFPQGPRHLSSFNRLVDILEAVSGVRIVDRVPLESGSRITYESSATLGVLDTLVCRGWLPLLDSDRGVALAVASIICQLASTEKSAPTHP